jgi:hypothetical protein
MNLKKQKLLNPKPLAKLIEKKQDEESPKDQNKILLLKQKSVAY